MKIVVVSTFYSEGMGYTENCLPKFLAAQGHDVHVIASRYNIYGTSDDYNETYSTFLGPAIQDAGEFNIDGYTVHRMNSEIIFGYVFIARLLAKINELSPDIIHSTEIASLQTFLLSALKPFFRFKLFTETHQHLSIVKPFLKNEQGNTAKKISYKITRTIPTFLASLAVEKCYAISPDCAYVAERFYGVPKKKIKMQSLGTDTYLFRPPDGFSDVQSRKEMRIGLGYSDQDIICLYTGRFSNDKNPLLLAKAIDVLSKINPSFHGLFIGEGIQRNEIERCNHTKIIPFMKYKRLAEFYRLADIAVWPTQESMSMLDAASSGLPLIVSNKIGELDRIEGNGKVFKENDVNDLCTILESLVDKNDRLKYGQAGRDKMLAFFSWEATAQNIANDYHLSLGGL